MPSLVAASQRLAGYLGTRFIRTDVYDLPEVLEENFDVVYTAMGALVWLPDLARWAQVVAQHLKPGGLFYLLDIHPASQVFDETVEVHAHEDLRVARGYFPDAAGTLYPGNAPSYVGEDIIESPAWEWQHSLAEILGALLDAGLRLTSFDEHSVTMFRQFPGMLCGDDGLWRMPFPENHIPLIFTLTATK